MYRGDSAAVEIHFLARNFNFFLLLESPQVGQHKKKREAFSFCVLKYIFLFVLLL